MKAGVRELLEKARDNIEAALVLVETRHLDAAASRAYYAMFYVAEALLAQIDQSYGKHAAVIAAFGREYAKTGLLDPEFHGWLIDAQDLRSAADYTTEAVVTEEKVREVCDRAAAFLDAARAQLGRAESAGDSPT